MNEQHEWMAHAACRGCDTNLFFAERGDHKTMMTALEICNGTKDTAPCPVRDQCLEWAMAQQDDNWGVFGGVSASVRMKMRRKERKNGERPVRNRTRTPITSSAPIKDRLSRQNLDDVPMPTNPEWHHGLAELVRVVHATIIHDENERRAKNGIGPVAIEIR